MLRRNTLFLAAVVLAFCARPADAAPRDSTAAVVAPRDSTVNEPIRMVADWLGNVTYGVNVKLAAIERDAGDPAPPAIQLIADETRNGIVARDRIPTPQNPGPVLTLSYLEESFWKTELEDKYRDCAAFPIEIRYADLDRVITEDGTRNGYYTIRATLRSLKDLMGEVAGAAAARRRNNVVLVNASDLVRIRPAMKRIEDKVIVVGLAAAFFVRDEAP